MGQPAGFEGQPGRIRMDKKTKWTNRISPHSKGPLPYNKCRKRDIDASGLSVKDIRDIPGLMDIPDWD